MLAARTLNLPYGDEGNQPPPTYEHNVLSYQWMAMMQCYDALYCQWFGGRPAAQNIAWLKPYYKLLFNAEYLPDPVALAVSLDTGFAETPEVFRRGLHQTTSAHYSLANLLRVLNINELSNAVKPVVLPGEEMVVTIIKAGKEAGQGVAYLNDGTMIVVDGGSKHIGETITVIVTSVLQTAAGRMIFTKMIAAA